MPHIAPVYFCYGILLIVKRRGNHILIDQLRGISQQRQCAIYPSLYPFLP